jgi:hypothetical protein
MIKYQAAIMVTVGMDTAYMFQELPLPNQIIIKVYRALIGTLAFTPNV